MPAKRIFSQEEKELIFNMYFSQKVSLTKIGELFGTTQTTVGKCIRDNGGAIRNRTDQFKRYTFNNHYFDSIDTPNKAYCLGLFYADGCNHLKDGDISIELQSGDVKVLEGIKNDMEMTYPIKFYSSEGKKNRTKDTCKLRFHDYHTSEQLKELGMIPNKSLLLEFPNWISKDLFPFMLRGYIDGDGWVQQYRIGWMSTSMFCEGVKSFLWENYNIDSHIMDMKRHYNSVTKTMYICNRKNIHPLVSMMFKSCDICIPRKKEKYIEYGFLNINNSLVV